MELAVWTWLVLYTVTALMSTNAKEFVICLTSEVYAQTLSCQSPKKILVHDEISYGVNTASCVEDCCPDSILCSESLATAETILNSCNGQSMCLLSSIIDIPLKSIECPESPRKNATFASIAYSCVDEITSPSVSPTALTTTSLSPALTSTTSVDESITSGIQETSRKDMNQPEKNSDLSLVIGLSIAGGAIIIAVVIAIAVCTTRNKRHRAYDSHNSTKTLATSDVESSSPGSGQSSEDVFGFRKSAEDRQERLQKRNDEIKRNQSFKSEEKKNKRPHKLNKHKSKSKSSSLDQLSTEKPKDVPESSNTKQSENVEEQTKTSKAKDDKKKSILKHEVSANSRQSENSNVHEKSKPNTDPEPHPVDVKSETNLLSI
ncbi:uncharacterized protein DDB_G0284459-like [Watersipora subatra]|uniref:uncharacterized protein DDB_G0284459-like n=1 Tax=Watersipora subatra TaxID=2589382 RepID=UPI00355B3170